MRQSRINGPSQSAGYYVPKLIATFLIGMISVFIGALTYSQRHQTWGATRPVSIRQSNRAAAPAQHAAPVLPVQTSVENPTRVEESSMQVDEQPQTTATSAGLSPLLFRPVSAADTSAHSARIISNDTPQQPGPARHLREAAQVTSPPEPKYSPASDTQGLYAAALSQSAGALLPQAHVDAIPSQPEAKVPEPKVQQPKVVTVQPGTSVEVRLAETLSSDRNRTGDTFRAVLDSPLVVDGFVIAETDSNVFGRIANARKAPLLGGKANLTLMLTNITTTDGRFVRIDTGDVEREGARSGVVNTAKMAGGAAVGAVIGALTGAAEGAGLSSAVTNDDRTNGFMATNRTVALPAGTRLSFSLASPLKATETVNR